LNYRELTRKLKSLGCVLEHYAKGSHEVWFNPRNYTRTTIPNWGGKDLKPGTISKILRDLGIIKSDFEKQ
jgi:predicted RNA binding protein YcfA (HicA-like mRNA interferase family)